MIVHPCIHKHLPWTHANTSTLLATGHNRPQSMFCLLQFAQNPFSTGLIWLFVAGYSTLILRNCFLMTAEILHCTWSLKTSMTHYGFFVLFWSFWLIMLLSNYHGQFKVINCKAMQFLMVPNSGSTSPDLFIWCGLVLQNATHNVLLFPIICVCI